MVVRCWRLPGSQGGCQMNPERRLGAQLNPKSLCSLFSNADRGKSLPFPGTLRAICGWAPPETLFAQVYQRTASDLPHPRTHGGVRNNKSKPEVSIPSLLCSHPARITLPEPSGLGSPALSAFLFQLDKLIFQATSELRKVWGSWRNPLLKNAKSFYLFFLTLLSYNLLLLGALSSLTKNQYPLHICKVLSGGKSAPCPSQ